MPRVRCKICDRGFYAKPSHLLMGWGKFCSTVCRKKGQYKGRMVVCFICKKETYKPLSELKKSKSGKFFCSKSCQTFWRNKIVFIEENHANWRHGRSTYRNILARRLKDKICTLCNNKDDRVLIVHHLDKNRNNNKIENLIWLCNNCHYLVHHYQDELDKLNLILSDNMVDVVQQ